MLDLVHVKPLGSRYHGEPQPLLIAQHDGLRNMRGRHAGCARLRGGGVSRLMLHDVVRDTTALEELGGRSEPSLDAHQILPSYPGLDATPARNSALGDALIARAA